MYLVNDVSEEYFIVKRSLCPKCCVGKLEVVSQSLLVNMLDEE